MKAFLHKKVGQSNKTKPFSLFFYQIIHKIVSDLRSRHPDVQTRSAKELFNYVATDLREVPPENLNAVLDYVTKHLLDSVKGDANALLGGILAVVALINALDVIDFGKTDTRFVNRSQQLLPCGLVKFYSYSNCMN